MGWVGGMGVKAVFVATVWLSIRVTLPIDVTNTQWCMAPGCTQPCNISHHQAEYTLE